MDGKHTPEEDQVVDISLLPKEKWSNSIFSPYLYFYGNFWCPSNNLPNVISLQTNFQAQDTDLLLATKPKSGTTWLKALAFALLHRNDYNYNDNPLLSANPQALVPFLEYPPPGTNPNDYILQLSQLQSPRLLSTHIPYSALPSSIRASASRIVYICRNPYNTIVSYLKYREAVLKGKKEFQVPFDQQVEDCVDSFCRGVEGFGPHWDHVLGYWNASLENPNKVLFLKYEDLKTDEIPEIKRLAVFLGVPFTPEEEHSGAVQRVSDLCSFRNLKELEVNKSGKLVPNVDNKAYFRKGEVGDWKNHITPALFRRLDDLMRDKFHGTGLTFKNSI